VLLASRVRIYFGNSAY